MRLQLVGKVWGGDTHLVDTTDDYSDEAWAKKIPGWEVVGRQEGVQGRPPSRRPAAAGRRRSPPQPAAKLRVGARVRRRGAALSRRGSQGRGMAGRRA